MTTPPITEVTTRARDVVRVVGDASLATAERGAAMAAHQADGFIQLLRDLTSFDVAKRLVPVAFG